MLSFPYKTQLKHVSGGEAKTTTETSRSVHGSSSETGGPAPGQFTPLLFTVQCNTLLSIN